MAEFCSLLRRQAVDAVAGDESRCNERADLGFSPGEGSEGLR